MAVLWRGILAGNKQIVQSTCWMVEKGVAGEAGVREVLPLRQQTVFSLNNKSFPILTILTFYPQKAPCNASVARIRGVYVSLLRRKLHWFCTLCVTTTRPVGC